MDGVEVNYLAILFAGISSMVVGMAWYARPVFGNAWMHLTGLNERIIKDNSNPMRYLYVFIASLVTAYVLAHVTFLSNQYFDNTFMQAALGSAFWLWAGFTAARILTHDLFENRRKKLTLINISHELVTILVMGAIIGSFGI
jgi:hypothetical protein